MEKELQSGGEIKELADTVDKLSKRLVKDTTAWTNKKENLEADQAACQQACLLPCCQLCCSKPEGCSSHAEEQEEGQLYMLQNSQQLPCLSGRSCHCYTAQRDYI